MQQPLLAALLLFGAQIHDAYWQNDHIAFAFLFLRTKFFIRALT